NPPGVVLLAHLPGLGEAWDQLWQAVALGQVPVDQRIIQLIADKAVAFTALIWLSRRIGDVGGRHANTQYPTTPLGHRGRQPEEHTDQRDRGEEQGQSQAMCAPNVEYRPPRLLSSE